MKWSHWGLYVVGLPWNLLVAWPTVILIRVLWGKDLRWESPPAYERSVGGGGGPCLTCQIRPGSFPVMPGVFPKGWYLHKQGNAPWGGTTLGHAIFYGPAGRTFPGDWTRTQAHEHIHVEQFEAAMLGSLVFGLASGVVVWGLGYLVAGVTLFLLLWTCGYLVMGVSGWLTAVLRGEEAYWGATHEESARAQDGRLAGRQ